MVRRINAANVNNNANLNQQVNGDIDLLPQNNIVPVRDRANLNVNHIVRAGNNLRVPGQYLEALRGLNLPDNNRNNINNFPIERIEVLRAAYINGLNPRIKETIDPRVIMNLENTVFSRINDQTIKLLPDSSIQALRHRYAEMPNNTQRRLERLIAEIAAQRNHQDLVNNFARINVG